MGTEDIHTEKAKLRQKIRAALHRLSQRDIDQWSLQIASYVFALEEFQRSRVVMTYVKMPGEVDTWPLIRRAWDEGKRITVPKIVPPIKEWDASRVGGHKIVAVELAPSDAESAEEHPNLTASRLGILEPTEGRAVDVGEIDLVLAPGLAFDREGWRLGKGGGFYDRFLSLPGLRAPVFGLAICRQIVENVPHGSADIQLAGVITEAGVIIAKQRGRIVQ